MSELTTINEEVKGVVKITLNSQYNNVNADEVHVAEAVSARVYGTIRNMVHLKKGSTLYLHGSFTGKLINEGGQFTVF